MKFIEEVEKTGKIPTFDLKSEYEQMASMNVKNKPSGRMINTLKIRKIIKILDEINEEHNTSWYRELRRRAERNMDALALFYRGNKISFREMFNKADKLAKSFKKSGIVKGDEISCCISNTPELIYTMLAASEVGAKLTIFGTHLDKKYMEEILNGNTNKLFIASDDNYAEIKDVVDKIGYEKKLLFSLADSLPYNPSICDEYVKDLDKYYHYDNLTRKYKQDDPTIISQQEFYEFGEDYTGKVEEEGTLNDEFLTTFTSGSTRKGLPSQIIHSNRSLIVSGYFNDLEISGSPRIPYQRGMCYIHSESNTNLVTCISDSLMKLWSVACEPEYSRDKALDVIRINNPSMIEMTTTHLIQMAKDYLRDFKNGIRYKFPNMIATFAVGEATSPGEEKLLNKVLRMAKAGSEVVVKGIKLPFAPLSVGGGDCEHGGIFYNVFNTVQAKKDMLVTKKKINGMAPVQFGVVTVLKKNKNGEYEECDYNEYGVIVANSATSMVGYKNNKEKTLEKLVRDTNGRDWLSCHAYGYIDKTGKVHQKDRVGNEIYLQNGNMILPSMLSDCVLSDSKNILSCAITRYDTENGSIPIINFELSPFMINNRKKALDSMDRRIKKQFGHILGDNYLYREFNNENRYPETGAGKRDFNALEGLGIEKTFKIYSKYVNDSKFNGVEQLDVESKIRK